MTPSLSRGTFAMADCGVPAVLDSFRGGEGPPVGAVGGDEVESGAGRGVVEEGEEAGAGLGRCPEGGIEFGVGGRAADVGRADGEAELALRDEVVEVVEELVGDLAGVG